MSFLPWQKQSPNFIFAGRRYDIFNPHVLSLSLIESANLFLWHKSAVLPLEVSNQLLSELY